MLHGEVSRQAEGEIKGGDGGALDGQQELFKVGASDGEWSLPRELTIIADGGYGDPCGVVLLRAAEVYADEGGWQSKMMPCSFPLCKFLRSEPLAVSCHHYGAMGRLMS